jgi:hypothetical protein
VSSEDVFSCVHFSPTSGPSAQENNFHFQKNFGLLRESKLKIQSYGATDKVSPNSPASVGAPICVRLAYHPVQQAQMPITIFIPGLGRAGLRPTFKKWGELSFWTLSLDYYKYTKSSGIMLGRTSCKLRDEWPD